MIGRLRGQVVEIEGGLAVIDVGGVGYEVWMPESVLIQLIAGESADLVTRQIFREDGVWLYGFVTSSQRRLFDLLLTVKGCGPKVGMALLGQVGEDSVISAILTQDSRILSRANGVGARLAERIALELRDKVQEEAILRKVDGAKSKPLNRPSDELTDALLGLGYRRSEVEAVADEARSGSPDVQEQLRAALRLLKK